MDNSSNVKCDTCEISKILEKTINHMENENLNDDEYYIEEYDEYFVEENDNIYKIEFFEDNTDFDEENYCITCNIFTTNINLHNNSYQHIRKVCKNKESFELRFGLRKN